MPVQDKQQFLCQHIHLEISKKKTNCHGMVDLIPPCFSVPKWVKVFHNLDRRTAGCLSHCQPTKQININLFYKLIY